MDVAAPVESSNQSQIAQEIGVSLLRKQLDTAQSSAARLLQVLPQQQASLEPGKGSMFDSYA